MKCIVFDFDGTIMDSKAAAQLAMDCAIGSLDLKCPKINLYNKPLFYPELLVKTIGEENGLTPQEERQLLSTYKEYLVRKEEEALIDEPITRCLHRLKSSETMIAIYSDRKTANLQNILEKLALADCFDLVCGRDLMQPKPSTQFIDFISSKYSISKKDILFIGDTDTDYQVAHRSGIYYAHAKYSRELSNESWKYCDRMIDTPESLDDLIREFIECGFKNV